MLVVPLSSQPLNQPSGPDHGERSSLDLIYGHLTDKPQFVPVQRAAGQSVFKNWFRPAGEWSPDVSNFVVSIQTFHAGGYEVVCTPLDLEQLARRADADRHHGERTKPEEQDPESVERSRRRAKKKVRHLIKSMGCDRLFTLTRRESNPADYWSREDWLKAWAHFVKSCSRAGVDLAYVAVLELHKKGNFHLHVALVGKIPINIVRRIWWAITGGRGQGNVDVKYKPHLSDYDRRAGLAKYVSKYLTKGFEETEAFNKKRYFASRHTLPELRRLILSAQSWGEAAAELSRHFGLDLLQLVNSRQFFKFPGKDGFWFNFTEEILAPCPF